MENQVNKHMIVEMCEKNREIKVINADCHEQVIIDRVDSGPFCRKDDLESTRAVIRQLQAALCEQQVRSNQIIMTLKLKLYKSQQAQKNQRLEAEKQMHEVMSSMLCLEAQLRRDHRSVCMALRQRNQEILVQRNQIKKLSEQNEQLLNAVKEIYGGMNGYLRDHSHRNGVNTSDSPTHRNSKDKEDKCERGNKEEKEDKCDKWDKHKPDKHKGKFSSVKDMLRRHRSSLELNSAELENVFHDSGFKFGSQENINQSSESLDRIGKFRNRSQTVSGYPENISGFLEESVKEDNSSNSSDTSKMSVSPHSARFADVIDEEDTVGSFIHHHGNITSVASMPMLATIQEDCYDKHLRAKERPHSMSSVDLIAIHKQVETLACNDSSPTTPISPISPDPPQTPPPPPSPSYTHTSSESNTFKLFKTMFRRKGNKMKNKKRSVSLSQNTDQEYDEALKKHFEKYDMS